jgi:hypothetical protein
MPTNLDLGGDFEYEFDIKIILISIKPKKTVAND